MNGLADIKRKFDSQHGGTKRRGIEATKTDRWPLKGLRGDMPLMMNGRPIDQAEAA